MKIIGMCGRSGSGKTTVAECFRERGIPTIDADRVYHEITSRPSPCLHELTSAFGKQIIAPDGSLDRRRLCALVFGADAEDGAGARLNSITHRHVLAEMERQIHSLQKAGARTVLCDVPLLFESGFDQRCDVILAVLADEQTRLSRLLSRDGISKEEAARRLAAQASDEFLTAHADFVIVNNGELSVLRQHCEEILEQIFK